MGMALGVVVVAIEAEVIAANIAVNTMIVIKFMAVIAVR